MSDDRFELTNDEIERRCPLVRPPGRRAIYWDSRLPGFGLVVGRTARSFVFQQDVAGRSVRVTIGRYPAWSAKRAREQAVQLMAGMRRGVNPNQQKRAAAARGVTVREAVDMHLADMTKLGRSGVSVRDLRLAADRYLGDWLARSLAEIRGKECRTRHDRLTTAHGPSAANRALATLRAAYNTAARVHDDLPPNPVGRAVRFNPVERRREPIPWDRLPAWAEQVRALGNPVRRDLQFLYLFTGLRATDGASVRWEHVNLGKEPTEVVVPNGTREKRVAVPPGCVHRPKPKGGKDRAFTVPLPEHVLGILRQRKAENPVLFTDGDGGWVFPTTNRAGEVVCVQEAKEQEYWTDEKGRLRKRTRLPTPHRLRDTFLTACREAGIGKLEEKLLANHSLPLNPGDVTEGYMLLSHEHLRACVEKVAAFLLARMANGRGGV